MKNHANEAVRRSSRDAEEREIPSSPSVAYLAAGAAYEIQNPLSRMMASVAMARSILSAEASRSEQAGGDGGSASLANGCLDEALEAAGRVRKLVLGLQAIGNVGPATTGETFDLHEALDLALDLVAPALSARARLEKRYGELPPVVGSFPRLTQALVDLLVNAVEAIPRGSAAANHVTVSTRADGLGGARLEIADTGVGIEPADMAHVFEPFFTGKPRPTSTGLGLTTARAAVQAAGGEITLESELGLGTRVVVCLRTAGMSRAPRTTLRSPARQRVVVVDDDPFLQKCLGRLVESERTDVVLATQEQALEELVLGPAPDLVVLALRDDGMEAWGPRERLERVVPNLASRIVEIAPPFFEVSPDTQRDFGAEGAGPRCGGDAEPRARLESSTQLRVPAPGAACR